MQKKLFSRSVYVFCKILNIFILSEDVKQNLFKLSGFHGKDNTF